MHLKFELSDLYPMVLSHDCVNASNLVPYIAWIWVHPGPKIRMYPYPCPITLIVMYLHNRPGLFLKNGTGNRGGKELFIFLVI